MGLTRYCLILLMLASSLNTFAQNRKNFYYLIRKDDIENGRLKIMYRDNAGNERKLTMCYEKLKAENLSLVSGVPVFHFEEIRSSKYDSVPNCISNSTESGRFEVDVKKHTIGDPNVVAKIPFRGVAWAISVIPFRYRPRLDNIDPSAESKVDFSVTYGYVSGYAKVNHEEITHYYITAGIFTGVTTASLKKETVSNLSFFQKEQNNPAISYGINLMFGRNNFGLSVSFGIDFSIGPNSSNWIYQNKPWIGLGISSNLGIF